MTETDVQNLIRLELQCYGITTFRANVGRVKMQDGRYFDTGLPVGFSDLFGVMPSGKAIFIECKKPNWKPATKGNLFEHEEDQRNFINQMRSSGALAGFASSVDEAVKIVLGADLQC